MGKQGEIIETNKNPHQEKHILTAPGNRCETEKSSPIIMKHRNADKTAFRCLCVFVVHKLAV